MPLELLFNPIMKATTTLGIPVPLAKANFYAAGSSVVRQNTYADAGQVTVNANPLIADSGGLFGPAFLLPLSYHLVITDPTGTITYFDQDNLAGASYSMLFDNSWQLKDNADPTKILQFQLSSITTQTTRTKTVADTNGTLLDSLYAIIGPTRFQMVQGSNVTAANDITLPSDGNMIQIIGATQINRIASAGWQAGSEVTLYFASTPTVKYNQTAGGGFASILLDGSGDFVAAANMTLKLLYNGNNAWVEVPRRS